MPSLWNRYQDSLTSRALVPDAEQEKAVRVLDEVLSALLQPEKKLLGLITIKKPTPKGLYLYGPVGRGKTMLMDLFLKQLESRHIHAERWHFHAFMLRIHQNLRELADTDKNLDNRIETLASEWAKRVKVLCFDEFHVTDVADAMIMMPFFTALFQKGVIVLATSNWQPEQLYSGGLQRQRFLPFIDTIKHYMRVVSVAGQTDYRQQKRHNTSAWLTPLDAVSEFEFDTLFRDAVGYDPIETHEIHVGSKTKGALGRTWTIPFASKGVARIDLSTFLAEPLGAADFIALSERYPLLFLDNLHRFNEDTNNKAKRFMVMIDVLYDRGTKLVVRADDIPENLYPPKGNLHFEFSRTVSRLKEMTPSVPAAA